MAVFDADKDISPGIVVSVPFFGGILALLMIGVLMKKVRAAPRGEGPQLFIADQIAEGAVAFLKTEYSYLVPFVVICAAFIVGILEGQSGSPVDYSSNKGGWQTTVCFLSGASLSALAGWMGMKIATETNVKTMQAAKESLNSALKIAFAGGAVMGFYVVALGILGLVVLFYAFSMGQDNAPRDGDTVDPDMKDAIRYLSGFGFGASSIALFARVAGGIYTKAADVGADLVGKVESDIPEDDPRNPATVADNVGDNVGDVAGMGADLFESFVGSIIAAVTLANGDIAKVMLPFWVAAAGIIASIIGFFAVGTKDGASQKELLFALHKGLLTASTLVAALTALIIHFIFKGRSTEGWEIFGCIIIGLVAGVLIGQATEYFTSYEYYPTKSITDAGVTGPATVIIQGLGIGMISTVPPVLVIVATILSCNALGEAYGISMAAVGMLSTLGVTLATDAYGPIADNAGGIAEMADLDERVRKTTDDLDALGNTTAATGKGFAIGSAVLTALSLLSAFKKATEITSVDIDDPVVLSGALIGAMLPFLFAALTMLSVQKAAGAIIVEVRRQFREIEGLRDGTAEADSDKCVAISTKSSIEEMILPGLYAILSPITVGFLVGPKCLVGLLGGSIASGMMLAIMMSNAGGAWDNAKKYIEIDGACGGKGTETHKACVVGDTVGDPFKDTSGPALNILIKLMSIISLTIAPLLKNRDNWQDFWVGLIPLVIMVVGTYIVVKLYWSDAIDLGGDLAPVAEKDMEANAVAEATESS